MSLVCFIGAQIKPGSAGTAKLCARDLSRLASFNLYTHKHVGSCKMTNWHKDNHQGVQHRFSARVPKQEL